MKEIKITAKDFSQEEATTFIQIQKGENVVWKFAGWRKAFQKYEQKVKLVNPKLYGRGYAIGDGTYRLCISKLMILQQLKKSKGEEFEIIKWICY